MPAPLDWKRAENIAIRLADRHTRPTSGTIQSEDFESMTGIAEDRVAATTGLRSLLGAANIRVVDRAEWIRANIASMQALLDPVLDRWGAGSVTGRVAGAEIGLMLGWMSGRVLGQYDLLVGDASAATDGAVYLVGPNMLAIEHKFGFDREQFRMWVALHELTHRAQFTGVPWMRQHFLGLTRQTLDLAEPNPARVIAAFREATRDRDAARQRLRDGGIVAMIATPEQQAVFGRVAGLMSLLEGHGDVVMDRAAADVVPSAPRFADVLRQRRQRAHPVAKVLQRLIGLEGKLNQYAAGERFIAAIETVGGERAIDICWERSDNLPSLDEIRSPHEWLERVG